MHFSFIAMKQWICNEKRIDILFEKPKFLWKVVISWISEFWNPKMPLPNLFITFLFVNFVKKFNCGMIFFSKRAQILWKIVKNINAMNFSFSLRWIFIARISFIAMNSLLAYMYNTYLGEYGKQNQREKWLNKKKENLNYFFRILID